MRRYIIAATLAAALAPAADAFSAAKLVVPKTYQLKCWFDRSKFEIYNTTGHVHPPGAKVTLVIVAQMGNRTHAYRRTVTSPAKLLDAPFYVRGVPGGTKQCSASAQLVPESFRR